MATRMGLKRLTLECKLMQETPTPYVDARPSEENILQWYFLLTGPPDTPYEGGQYLGALKFPSNYPYGPPNIRMLTPSGRFVPDTSLCLSMSDFHQETWNPAWNVSTILTGLLSFMTSDDVATGAMKSSDERKKMFAKASVKWNLKNQIFRETFPDVLKQITEEVPDYASRASIEVIPPKASDVAQNIHKSAFKGAAVEIANEAAKNKAFLNETPANDQGGGNDNNNYVWLLGAAIFVLIAFLIYV